MRFACADLAEALESSQPKISATNLWPSCEPANLVRYHAARGQWVFLSPNPHVPDLASWLKRGTDLAARQHWGAEKLPFQARPSAGLEADRVSKA